MPNNAIHHFWNAEEYHHHSFIQKNAATQFLQLIRLKGNERILDVGCGDGKITAAVASRVPDGSVLGIDISSEMIEFAKKLFPKSSYPNLVFLPQDAQFLDYDKLFDIIFSSFAIQWITDPDMFFKRAYQSLKSSGYLAVIIPLDISLALENAIDKIMSLSKWSSYFQSVQKWKFTSDNEFAQLLGMHKFVPNRFDVVLQEVIFPSRENFEKYVIQWFPYLNPLPQHLKQVFFKQVIDKYLEIEPILKDGKIRFKFSRLEIIAAK